MPKKKFIDKRKDKFVSFNLVHRSQRDPLAADSDAPQMVLSEIATSEEIKKRKEEEREHGVFYDDDYDYMQHLKDKFAVEHDWDEADRFFMDRKDESGKTQTRPVSSASAMLNEARFNLPKGVFETQGEEEDVGLLNKAAPRSGPRLDWDPDIVETLDDDYECEVICRPEDDDGEEDGEGGLDDLDDLLAAANQEPESGDEEEEDYDSADDERSFDSDELNDDVPSLDGGHGGFAFAEEETKSRFTEYSMSSSVIRRNEQLTNLDDRFEEFFNEYADEETGGLEMDEIEGFKSENSKVMGQLLKEYEKGRQEAKDRLAKLEEEKERGQHYSSDSEEEVWTEKIEVKPEEKWDCETIISTYSNIYHHPKLITDPPKKNFDKININFRTGMPKDVLGKGLTAGALKRLDRENEALKAERNEDLELKTVASRVSALSIRTKGESLAEKKARKTAFKEFKRERRVEKKANQKAFMEEKQKQERNQINLRKSTPGQKLI